VKEKFGGKNSALIFAPRFWKSERKGWRKEKKKRGVL